MTHQDLLTWTAKEYEAFVDTLTHLFSDDLSFDDVDGILYTFYPSYETYVGIHEC